MNVCVCLLYMGPLLSYRSDFSFRFGMSLNVCTMHSIFFFLGIWSSLLRFFCFYALYKLDYFVVARERSFSGTFYWPIFIARIVRELEKCGICD